MAVQNGKFLQLPQGTEGIHLEEALRHRRLTRNLNDLFTSWGFLPVKTPVFDFYDNYRDLMKTPGEENIYRLMDREGDLLLLRSDVTLFLARQMGLYLNREDLPVRVSYADTILRHQNREDISKNEFFQTGVELIGVEGYEGDMEVLLLLDRTLTLLNVPSFLHLGSRNLFRLMVPADRETPALMEALKSRNRREISEELARYHSPLTAQLFSRLLLFIGSPDEFRQRLAGEDLKDHADLVQAGEYLLKLTEGLETLGGDREIRIDLSEIGSQPYHTGIVFQVYCEGVDSAVVSGGRYDRLLENFGLSAPSVGFSLLLRKIEALLPPAAAEEENLSRVKVEEKELHETEENRFILRFRRAEELRKNGRNVSL
jgi:ATP phosphoribosyltransferase regulatory subunit